MSGNLRLRSFVEASHSSLNCWAKANVGSSHADSNPDSRNVDSHTTRTGELIPRKVSSNAVLRGWPLPSALSRLGWIPCPTVEGFIRLIRGTLDGRSAADLSDYSGLARHAKSTMQDFWVRRYSRWTGGEGVDPGSLSLVTTL